jgi:hypothetical protein
MFGILPESAMEVQLLDPRLLFSSSGRLREKGLAVNEPNNKKMRISGGINRKNGQNAGFGGKSG